MSSGTRLVDGMEMIGWIQALQGLLCKDLLAESRSKRAVVMKGMLACRQMRNWMSEGIGHFLIK